MKCNQSRRYRGLTPHTRNRIAARLCLVLGASLVSASSLSYAAGNGAPPARSAATTPASASAVAARITIDGMDPSVAPGDDFNAYVNGGWMKTAEIPADKRSWGNFGELTEQTNKLVAQLVADAGQAPAGSQARKVGDFYAAYLDAAAIEARGSAPLQPALEQIAAIGNKTALARYLGSALRADVDPLNASIWHTDNLFGLWVAQGFHDPSRYTAYLLQGGLGMPDREYYLSKQEKMAELRAKYQQHIAAMLKLGGVPEPEAAAARVFALEQKIAQSHATREQSADIAKADHRWTAADFVRQAKGLDWAAYFDAAGLAKQQSYSVWHPGAVKGEAALVAAVPLADWKDYLRFHAINHQAGVLPQAFTDQHFAFYDTALAGTPQQSPRWQRALNATNNALGEAVGKLYVEKHFSPAAKAKARTMVDNILAAFSRRIDALTWMAPATKAEARAKLNTMYVGVGYPDRWRDYAGLEVRRDDAFGNQTRAEAFTTRQQIAKLGQPVDATEWSIAPQIINAVNMPMQNAINFPAAVLQPPFFDLAGSDAANYGTIGATIGHEISHSFDNQGAQFDSKGRLRNWWSKADFAHFQKSSQALVAQYSRYRPFPDLAVNGQLTLGENIADLAGLLAAYDALHMAHKGQAEIQADSQAAGQTKTDFDREFFLAYGQGWRSKTREQALRNQITTNEHAPSQYRMATVRNLDAWYAAFDVRPGQALYLAPRARVRVW